MKDYAELIRRLENLAVDMDWPLMAEAAVAIRELQQDAARYQWLKTETRGGSFNTSIGFFIDDVTEWDDDLDAAMKGTA